MGENGFGRFPGNLDPTAREFWPTFPPPPPPPPLFRPPPPPTPPPYHFLPPPPQLYYSYGPPSPTYYPPAEPTSPPPVLPPATLPPTRAILLSSVPGHTSESAVRRDLEVFGDVRAVQMERVREGIVAVHFYDLRAAHAALDHICHQHMHHQHRLRLHYTSPLNSGSPPPSPPPGLKGLVSGRVVWAQFVLPALNAFPDGHNQGTIVVFNLHPHISRSFLGQIFETFGPIRELRETPMKKHQKFVEFYDVRDAAAALSEMNGKEIGGNQVAIEFSRPGGGHRRRPQYPPPPPPYPPIRRIFPTTPRAAPSSSSQAKKSVSNIGNTTLVNVKNFDNPADNKDVESFCEGSSISELSLNGNDPRSENDGRLKKCEGSLNSLSSGSSGAVVITKKNPVPREGKNKPWKGKSKSLDPRFLIKEDAIIDSNFRDTRTTVMIKNIPNKYSQKLLLNMLDNHCIHCNEQIANQGAGESQTLSSYDFLYLPIDFNNKCNVGYGFVNMTSPEAALRLYKSFNQQHWEVFNSRKICEVTYARVQGLEALKEHFKNSKFACETEEYLPVVFSPPRDGRAHLTDPLPIVPCSHVSTSQNDNQEGSTSGTTTSATTVSVLSSSPSLSSDGACGDGNNDGGEEYGGVLGEGSGSSSNGGEDYHDEYDVGQ